MIAKTFEIRDRATFIPALAVRLMPGCEADRYLIARAGFGRSPSDQRQFVMLMRVDGGSGAARCDPHDWPGGARTFPVAHAYIIKNWDVLESGAVICVESILGEIPEPKQSERISEPLP